MANAPTVQTPPRPGLPPAPLQTDLAPARVVEIGEITAGIAVPEDRGVRFFSSSRPFDPLDGTLFRTLEQANRAARALAR